MTKVDGCWANVLDDCEGELTGEHLISVAVWEPTAGCDNRESKLDKQVTVHGGPAGSESATMPLKDLVAHVLCRHHNNCTHDVDEAGGKFRKALASYFDALDVRDRGKKWPSQRWAVHGPHLEQWFMKTAITNAIRFNISRAFG